MNLDWALRKLGNQLDKYFEKKYFFIYCNRLRHTVYNTYITIAVAHSKYLRCCCSEEGSP